MSIVNDRESGQKPQRPHMMQRGYRGRGCFDSDDTGVFAVEDFSRPPDDLKLHLSPPSTIHMCSSLREEMSGGGTSPGGGRAKSK